ncbi:MAG: phosphoribosylanthranilate isomerase [Deferrisomatales bacterium]
MTRIKVCGITRREDALRAAEWGADAVGFVFAPRSRRRADPAAVARIVEELPPFVTPVGVFQDQPVEEVRAVARDCGLAWVQLHGGEDAAYLERLGLRAIKAVGLARRSDVDTLGRYPGLGCFLLDAAVGGASGGTGKTFDWSWAVEAKRYGRILLAGGLGPDNVEEAIRRVRPWGVDGASATESAPGVKDPDRLRRFIGAVRRTDLTLADEDTRKGGRA